MASVTPLEELALDVMSGIKPVASGAWKSQPHFPDPDDEDQRIRMGSPAIEGMSDQRAEEHLLHRYREVISGASPQGWTVKDYLDGFRFEWALADLRACQNCEACQEKQIKRKKPEDQWENSKKPEYETVHSLWLDCRTVAGHGHYMTLHRKRTQEVGKPVFVMTECPGPNERFAEIARGQVSYHA